MLQHSSAGDSEHTDSLRHHRLTEPSKLAVQISRNTAERWDDIRVRIRPSNRRLKQKSLRAVFSHSRSLHRSRRTMLRTASSNSTIDRYQRTIYSQQYPAGNLHDLGYISWILQPLPNKCHSFGRSYD